MQFCGIEMTHCMFKMKSEGELATTESFQITAKCIIGTMRKSQHQPLLMNTCTVMSICIIFFVYVLYNLVMGINSVNSSIVHNVPQRLWALLFSIQYWSFIDWLLRKYYMEKRWNMEEIVSKFPWHMIWHALCVFGTTHIRQISTELKVNFSSIHSASPLWWEKDRGIKRKSWTMHALYASVIEGKG